MVIWAYFLVGYWSVWRVWFLFWFFNQIKTQKQKTGMHAGIPFSCDWQFVSPISLDACIILHHDHFSSQRLLGPHQSTPSSTTWNIISLPPPTTHLPWPSQPSPPRSCYLSPCTSDVWGGADCEKAVKLEVFMVSWAYCLVGYRIVSSVWLLLGFFKKINTKQKTGLNAIIYFLCDW